MKKVFILFIIVLSVTSYSQTESKIDSPLKTKKDSIELRKLKAVGDETAKYLSTRSIEEKEWFKKTFVRKRGTFTIPKEPITYPFKD
tara:strand:- start:92 stop:352 length:261 start_codon:yes stop_codon:yes gene_type:complete